MYSMRIFLSYSRKDIAFTERLASALLSCGFKPDFDLSVLDPQQIDFGISAQDEWWKRIQEMIACADAIALVVSPDSATSMICDKEISYARLLGKRIIPVLHRPTDFTSIVPQLSALNIKISFMDNFDHALRMLCAALEVDVDWHREGSRLATLATRWDLNGRPDELLVGPADVLALGNLFERRPDNAEPPAPLLLDLRDRSRSKLQEIDLRRRTSLGRAFVGPARTALSAGMPSQALRRVAAGALLASDTDFSLVPELWNVATKAICANKVIAMLHGHSSSVLVAKFSPNGSLIVTVAKDGIVVIWDGNTGELISRLVVHTSSILDANFSPDSERVVTASSDHAARVWDARTGEMLYEFVGHTASLRTAEFSSDGRLVVTASDDFSVRLWNANSGQQIAILAGHRNKVKGASFSRDDLFIITYSSDGTVRLWDVSSGVETHCLNDHAEPIWSATFGPDNREIVSVSGSSAKVQNLQTGKVTLVPNEGNLPITSASLSRDGKKLVTTNGGRARIWDTASGLQTAVLELSRGWFASAAFSTDDAKIITTSIQGIDPTDAPDVAIRVWDSENGEELLILKDHESLVRRASFSPDGKRALSVSNDGVAIIWDLITTTEIACFGSSIDGVYIQDVRLSADGRVALAVFNDNTVRLWDVDRGVEKKSFEFGSGRPKLSSFSPDMSLMAAAFDEGVVKLWELEGGRQCGEFVANTTEISQISFNNAGDQIVAVLKDNSVELFDVVTGSSVARLTGHKEVVNTAKFNRDGSLIVTSSADKSARVWETKTGAQLCVLQGHKGVVTQASFNADGTLIVTASDDKTVRLWSPKTGELIAGIGEHKDRVCLAQFGPNDSCLVTISVDFVARIWRLKDGLVHDAPACFNVSQSQVTSFTSDGNLLMIVSADGQARIFDVFNRVEICTINTKSILGVKGAVSGDGRRLYLTCPDGSARVWDISRIKSAVQCRKDVLASIVSRGVGLRTVRDSNDVLMQSIPEDMLREALDQINRSKGDIEQIATEMRAPAHSNCYMSSSEFTRKFGRERLLSAPSGNRRKKPADLLCSFCGKNTKQVRKLVAGFNAHICNECVDACNDVLAEK